MRYSKDHKSLFDAKQYRIDRRAKRAELALCTRCDNPAAKGLKDCAECIEKMRSRERERREKSLVLKQCLYCNEPADSKKLRCNNCSEKSNRNSRKRQRECKLEVLSHYGKNGKLQCCWVGCKVADIDMLTLDHINNDGAEHRKIYTKSGRGGGSVLYTLLIRKEFPEGFQTLCANHNLKKHIMTYSKEV